MPAKPIISFRNTGLATLFITASLILVFAIWGLSDFEQPKQNFSTHTINFNNETIAGTLILPKECTNPAIAIFVHGDGPQDRWHNDGYLPLIHSLLSDCIGVFSWDKPGVGQSSGNWLNQTMDTRAELANTVLAYLSSLPELADNRIGYLGFSQAGWVVPVAASIARPDFSVLIGVAVNWQEQGMFFTRTRLRLGGMKSDDVDTIAEQIHKDDKALFDSENNKSDDQVPDDMDSGRLEFIRLNYNADARDAIQTMQGPVMALWGTKDMNVDATKNAEQYRQLLQANAANKIVVVPDATHSLLKARWFNYQTFDQWPLTSQLLIAAMGRRAYVPGVLDSIASWINNPTASN